MNAEDALNHTELLDRYMRPAVDAIAEKMESDLVALYDQLAVGDASEEDTLP